MDTPQTRQSTTPPGGAAALAVDPQATDDLAVEVIRADVGELARPLAHEFNNFLNNLLLNLAILEQADNDAAAAGLGRLRRQADHVAALIKQFHDFRARRAPPPEPIDVNAEVEAAVQRLTHEYSDLLVSPADELASPALPLKLELATGLRSLRGTRADFARLLFFLLKNVVQAARAARTEARLVTTKAADHVAVHIDILGTADTSGAQGRLFESLGNSCPGMSSLELAACASIARRFRGKFHAEDRPEGGLGILLELPSPA